MDHRRRQGAGIVFALALACGCREPQPPPEPVREQAKPPPPSTVSPDFEGVVWTDGAPELRGRIALVRWWTNGCSLCSTSAPALTRLNERAAVVAVYHPKPPRDVTPEQVRAWAKAIGMPGTAGIDRDWAVLRRWAPPDSRFTSLTFLLDRRGKVRYVHPGGTIEAADEVDLRQRIEGLRAERE